MYPSDDGRLIMRLYASSGGKVNTDTLRRVLAELHDEIFGEAANDEG
jgi:hypothetical protein